MRDTLDGRSAFNRKVGIGEMRETLDVQEYTSTSNITDGERTALTTIFTMQAAVRQIDDVSVRDEKAMGEYQPSYIAVAVNDERLKDNMFILWRKWRMRIKGIERNYQFDTMRFRLAVDKANNTT